MTAENGVLVSLDRTEEVLRSIQELTKKVVLVGIPSTDGGRSGAPINNATLAYIHEFGSPARNIPARPFLHPTINRLRDQAVAMLRQAADYQMDHKPGDALNQLEALGTLAVAAVKNNIVAGGDPRFAPLAAATIARKGSTSPLIDTGQLLNSITYVIRDKG